MQYGQRKLHRSVTEIRRSRSARPNASGNPGPPSNTTGSGAGGPATTRGRRGGSWIGSTGAPWYVRSAHPPVVARGVAGARGHHRPRPRTTAVPPVRDRGTSSGLHSTPPPPYGAVTPRSPAKPTVERTRPDHGDDRRQDRLPTPVELGPLAGEPTHE